MNKTCILCSVSYAAASPSQKVCIGCRDKYRRQQNTANLARMRRAAGSPAVGDVLMCERCGDDFEYRAGPQKRCQECQKRVETDRIHEWLASDGERLKKYTAKARDNYKFAGNRQAALERDNHTCQRCGSKDDLHVHHIDGKGTTTERESRNNALENLITLCRGCHTRVHHEARWLREQAAPPTS